MRVEWLDEEAGRLKIITDNEETCSLDDVGQRVAALIARKAALKADIAETKAFIISMASDLSLTKAQLIELIPALGDLDALDVT